jgi:hypothetical protein
MKKLLIVVGAGASVEFGMPSVWDVDKLFEDWAQERVPLTGPEQGNLYSWVKKRVTDYVSQNSKNRVDGIINFESLLYTIQSLGALAGDVEKQQFANRLNAFGHMTAFPEIKMWNKEKIAEGEDFWFLHSRLVDSLLVHFRQKCSTLVADKPSEVAALREFLLELKQEYDLGIVNLNYDNVILSAMPELRTGFDPDSGEFKRELLYDDNWNFCYHLHGSVHFDMRSTGNTPMHKIFWNNDLSSVFSSNSSGRNNNYTLEGIPHLTSGIIAGLDKANQTLSEPFGQFFAHTDRLIYEADAILFLGYGFNDLHLNRKFPFIRYDKTKHRKVVIVDYAQDDKGGLNFRWDSWTHGVFSTLPYNGREMGSGKKVGEPKLVAHYKKKKNLEKSSNEDLPLAIWYNGMLEACRNSSVILNELRSNGIGVI